MKWNRNSRLDRVSAAPIYYTHTTRRYVNIIMCIIITIISLLYRRTDRRWRVPRLGRVIVQITSWPAYDMRLSWEGVAAVLCSMMDNRAAILWRQIMVRWWGTQIKFQKSQASTNIIALGGCRFSVIFYVLRYAFRDNFSVALFNDYERRLSCCSDRSRHWWMMMMISAYSCR